MATEKINGPDLSSLVIGVVRVLIEEAPGAIAAIRALLEKENPTEADYDAAAAQIQADSYSKLVPHSELPKDEPGQPS